GFGMGVTPFVAISVALRFPTFNPPASRKAKSIVTVSFGSMTPFGAPAPLSETIADPAGTTKLPVLSLIVRVAAFGEARTPLLGLNNWSRTVTFGWTAVVSMTGTVNVRSVTPLVNSNVPFVGVYWMPGSAVPFVAEKVIVATASVRPVRKTSIVAK